MYICSYDHVADFAACEVHGAAALMWPANCAGGPARLFYIPFARVSLARRGASKQLEKGMHIFYNELYA